MLEQLGFYLALKWAGYSAWCGLGLFWAGAGVRPFAALGWGLARMVLGMVVGTTIFFTARAWSLDPSLGLYVVLYVPVRALEWALLLRLMRGGRPAMDWKSPKSLLWIGGAVAISFATDWASPLSVGERLGMGRLTC
jgi:hypothetical protein